MLAFLTLWTFDFVDFKDYYFLPTFNKAREFRVDLPQKDLVAVLCGLPSFCGLDMTIAKDTE